ncbi:MAG: hypothetical protein FWE67_11230 [Planctomycetaceae bacterium]|nr:hypothetical protein [Planctomycetaceae bacterium]
MVGFIIEQSAEEVALGKEKKLYTLKKIVLILKEMVEFKDTNDGAIERGIRREPAWKNRKKH